jgi:hypothetical protein
MEGGKEEGERNRKGGRKGRGGGGREEEGREGPGARLSGAPDNPYFLFLQEQIKDIIITKPASPVTV